MKERKGKREGKERQREREKGKKDRGKERQREREIIIKRERETYVVQSLGFVRPHPHSQFVEIQGIQIQ